MNNEKGIRPAKYTKQIILKTTKEVAEIKKLLQEKMHLNRGRLQKLIFICIYNIFKLITRLDNKRILLLSNSRTELGGNLKYIYDELCNEKDYNIRCLVKAPGPFYRKISDKILLPYLIATSKYIVLEENYPAINILKLRKGTKVIQAWHAMGAFKKMGFSRMGQEEGPSVKSKLHKNYTDVTVSSEAIRKDYAEAFRMDISNIHPIGIPRTDIFFDKEYIQNKKEEIYGLFPMLKGKKVILFAPTFRGTRHCDRYYDTSLLDFKHITESLGDDYVFIVKLHPTIKNEIVFPANSGKFYLDLTAEYRDINDLLLVTDILVTDYSSVIFEYSLLKRPIIFFVPDYDDYIKSRGFYYDFEKYAYGPKVKQNRSLITAIKKAYFNEKKHSEFINFFCSACDGNSTRRFVEHLIINNK